MISTKNLDKIIEIEKLKKLCQSIAVLDAIISPDWEFRYYSFNKNWSDHEMMASMRNGEGSELHILFNEFGACINGFDNNSIMSPWINKPPQIWPGVVDTVPNEFQEFINTEPIPTIGTTFIIWRKYADSIWNCGKIQFPKKENPDGSKELLKIFDGNPETYKSWADKYYEIDISIKNIELIYQHKKLTDKLIQDINPDLTLKEIQEDLSEIGY
jgi:hypothetical protein